MGSPRPDLSLRAGIWVSLCVLITAAATGSYVIGQQAGRLGADDVPRAMAARAAEQLSQGMSPAQAVGASPSNLVTDPTPFVIVYDRAHRVLASGATVAAEPPALPSGVLDAAVAGGEHHVSWQPIAGVREAVVALSWGDGRSSGVVVAGASLQPTETRSRLLLGGAVIGWLILLSAVTVVFRHVNSRLPERPRKPPRG
jgi:hypothetical protein